MGLVDLHIADGAQKQNWHGKSKRTEDYSSTGCKGKRVLAVLDSGSWKGLAYIKEAPKPKDAVASTGVQESS